MHYANANSGFYTYSCGPNWDTSNIFDIFYNWYLMICGLFIPTVILVICNIVVVSTSNKVLPSMVQSRTRSLCGSAWVKSLKPTNLDFSYKEKNNIITVGY